MLTVAEIQALLELLAQEEVASFEGYTVTKPAFGYSKDAERRRLQAKLSIMLEVAGRREEGAR